MTHRDARPPAAAADPLAAPAPAAWATGAAAGGALELGFDFDEALVLLGGGTLAAVLATRREPGPELSTPAAVDQLARLDGGPQWLFAHDPARFGLEVLRAKLTLLLDVCDGVAAVHTTGQPHLALEPQNIRVTWRAVRGAPARWQFAAAVGPAAVLGATGPTGTMTPGRPAAVAVGASAAATAAWLPPWLTAPAVEVEAPVVCWQAGDADGLVRFVVQADGSSLPPHARAGDLVAVRAAAGGPTLLARVDDAAAGRLLATALLPADDACLAWHGERFDARLRLHVRPGPSVDVFTLGLLLLRACCVDDGQDLDAVRAALVAAVEAVDAGAPAGLAPAGEPASSPALAAALHAALHTPGTRGPLDAVHLLHRHADRHAHLQALAGDAAVVDPAIWTRVLAIAARALGAAPRVVHATDATLPAFVAEIRAVLRRLDVELFDAAACAAAIGAALDEAADGHGDDDDADGGAEPADSTPAPPAPPGFCLELRRDGDAAVQPLTFRIDAVTIGRREGHNLLRLADPMVSSLHAVIQAGGDGFEIVDRNSTNGTEVDGIRLPVDVPHPLHDGSIILIRPFQLVFRELAALPPAGPPAAAVLHDRLRDVFATHAGASRVRVHDALLAALRDARQATTAAAWSACADELRVAVDPTPPFARGLQQAAARALAQLSEALLDGAAPATPQQVQQFAARLARFVESTSEWIARMLELRKVLGRHLELGLASTAGARTPVRSAAEVRALVVGWRGDAASAASADPTQDVNRFYADLTAVMVGLLRGNQQARRALRERLDPARLAELAARDPAARAAVQAAATSPLWRVFVETFVELTGGSDGELELERLLRSLAPAAEPPG